MPHSIQACYNLDQVSFLHILSNRFQHSHIFELTQVFEEADPKITATAVNGKATVIKDRLIDEVTPQGIFVRYSKLTEVEDDASWEFLLKTLSLVEKKKVLQFFKKDDQKRSLLSILLQKSTIRCVPTKQYIYIYIPVHAVYQLQTCVHFSKLNLLDLEIDVRSNSTTASTKYDARKRTNHTHLAQQRR